MSCMSHHILIAGDFNIHIDIRYMDSSTKFIQLLDQYNLHQHVNAAAHPKGHALHLVIAKRDDSIIETFILPIMIFLIITVYFFIEIIH